MSPIVYRFAPAICTAFYNMFKQYLLLNKRTAYSIMNHLIFLVIALSTTRITLSNGSTQLDPQLLQALILVFLTFTLFLASDNLILVDYQNRLWEQYLLTGIALEVYIAARLIAHTLVYYAIFLIALPVLSILMSGSLMFSLHTLFIGLPLFLFIVSSLLAFSSSLILSKSKMKVLGAVLTLPLITPIIITMLLIEEDQYYLLLLLGIVLSSFPALLWGLKSAIKINIHFE